MPTATAPDGIVFRNRDVKGAATHVLIVGVGHYPNLRDGGQGSDDNAPLGQLETPSLSVRRLASWFIEHYNYPDAPLATVALLSADVTPEPFASKGKGYTLVNPTYAAFSTAAQSWIQRGDTAGPSGNAREHNRLIFIFCGHGFGYGTEASLLMSDFDFRRMDKWDSAVDVGDFHAGMDKCAAAEQIFFLDACRTEYGDLADPYASIGRTPIHAGGGRPFAVKRNAPIIYSTGDKEPARGKLELGSVFTEAFLRAVGGMGAREDEGDWRVGYYSLLEAMGHVAIKLTKQAFPEPQQPQGTESKVFEFHRLNDDPVSTVYVDREAGNVCGPGELVCQSATWEHKQPCHGEPEVEVLLPLGNYKFELREAGASVASADGQAAPIYRKARLK
jgi:hypothetical protein